MGSSGYEKYNRNICHICINGKKGIGFICKITKSNSNESVRVLITNSSLLPSSEITTGKKIICILNDNSHTLLFDESRKIYCNENDYNITIIEIKIEDKINPDYFFEVDLYETITDEEMQKKSVSLIIPKNKKIELKKCNIKSFETNSNEIEYTCDIKEELYGCPLINSKNDKIIGIQKKYNELNKKCQGILLSNPIKEFFKPKIENKKIENPEIKEEVKLSMKKAIKESVRSVKSIKKEKLENDIILTYVMPTKEFSVKIFGSQFVKNNKDKAYFILYDGIKNEFREYDLCEYINIALIPEFKYKMKTFSVILVQTDYFIDLSYMFYDCYYFLGSKEISKINTEKTTNMSCMFFQCDILNNLEDLGDLNTSNVTNMYCMFGKCIGLEELPDLSKWDTSKVTTLKAFFTVCTNLKTVPGMEKWDVSNVTDVSFIFNECANLEFPDISSWNTENFQDMSYMFKLCKKNLPDISKWNLKNAKTLAGIFMLSKFEVLPDISKWNVSNVENFRSIFTLPIFHFDISGNDINELQLENI
jgi:surface protein